MKKIIVLCLALLVVVACVVVMNGYKKEDIISVIKSITRETTKEENQQVKAPSKEIDKEKKNKEKLNEEKTEKMYAVWLTYSEIGELVKGKGEAEYKNSLEKLFADLNDNKINTVFYQCRAFCDSFYTSEIFPVSKYISAGNNKPIFDPMEIFLQMGKEKGVAVHCWVNPYRVSYDNDFDKLPKSSPVRSLYKEDKNTLIICEEGIFLNPAHIESHKLVLSGIKEILEKYQVSGIHFDDYFYPESENMNDKALYKKYSDNGGSLSVEEWRRENVNALIGAVYTLVKAYNSSLLFSISPSADIKKCKNVYYADVEKWCSEDGFADYIIPQIYYGFQNERMPFTEILKEWESLGEKGKVKLVCGLAPYKCGKPDKFAGKGKNEWTENVNILSQQYEQVLKNPVWQGFSLFSYSHCFGQNVSNISKKEIKKFLYMVK